MTQSAPATEAAPAYALAFVGTGEESPEDRQLLHKMIAALGLTPEQAPLLTPTQATAQPQLARAFVALGESAARALSGTGANVAPTYHPSELRAHPELKRQAWADLQEVAHDIGLNLPSPSKGTQ